MSELDYGELDYGELDPGIRETVRWLRAHGFDTCDSGDGETKDIDDDCALDVPHVFMEVEPAEELKMEADRLVRLVDTLKLPMAIYEESVHIEATYDPVDGIALLMLQGLDDAVLGKHL